MSCGSRGCCLNEQVYLASVLSSSASIVDKVPRTLIRLTEAGREVIQTYREQMRMVIDQLLA